jgi:2-C-methyl-D-erythritol 4-phosphate cytidylyltransferase
VSSKTRLHKKQQQPQPLLLHDACRAKHRQRDIESNVRNIWKG